MEQKMKDRYIHAVSMTDASGVAIQHLEYMSFGEVFVDQRRTGFGTPYKFNAKELDCESGYYYYVNELVEDIEMSSERVKRSTSPAVPNIRDEERMRSRYYDPRMARFLSVDPLAGEMPAWGSYTYTFDNPVRLVDPTGMRPEECPTCPDGADDGATHVWGGETFRYNNGSWGTDLPVIGVTAKEGGKNESGGGFFSGIWSWFSGLVSPGSAQPGTDDGLEVMALGGGNITSEGSASKIVDMKKFPGTNIPIASAMFMRHLSNVSSDAYNVVNTVARQAGTVSIGLELAETFQSGIERREKNVVDTQEWKVGNFIIRHRVESYLNPDGKAGGANGTIIDTPYIIKY